MSLNRLREAETAFRKACDVQPNELAGPVVLATCLAKLNKPMEALQYAQKAISGTRMISLDKIWDLVLDFYCEIVRHGHARECLRSLDESELGERWTPLREAIAAVVADSGDYLRRVAPEVRSPAQAILTKFDVTFGRRMIRGVKKRISWAG